MLKSRWRRWNDKAVLHLDYANFKTDIDALRVEVAEADAEIQREPKGTVLVLIDLRDTVASGAVVQLFKERSMLTQPFIKRHALIGITGHGSVGRRRGDRYKDDLGSADRNAAVFSDDSPKSHATRP